VATKTKVIVSGERYRKRLFELHSQLSALIRMRFFMTFFDSKIDLLIF